MMKLMKEKPKEVLCFDAESDRLFLCSKEQLFLRVKEVNIMRKQCGGAGMDDFYRAVGMQPLDVDIPIEHDLTIEVTENPMYSNEPKYTVRY